MEHILTVLPDDGEMGTGDMIDLRVTGPDGNMRQVMRLESNGRLYVMGVFIRTITPSQKQRIIAALARR